MSLTRQPLDRAHQIRRPTAISGWARHPPVTTREDDEGVRQACATRPLLTISGQTLTLTVPYLSRPERPWRLQHLTVTATALPPDGWPTSTPCHLCPAVASVLCPHLRQHGCHLIVPHGPMTARHVT